MGTAADPLRTLARMALDDEQHRLVRASRDGDLVEVSDGELRWLGSVTAWNRALQRAAGLKVPSSDALTIEGEKWEPVPKV